MNRRTWGILATVVGSALGAWYLSRSRMVASRRASLPESRDHGTVIFDNTPTASDTDAI